MATHSSVLAWRIPWTEEPGYRPWGCKESDTTKWLTLPLEEIWKLSHTPKGFGTQGSPTSRPLCIIILQAWFCRLCYSVVSSSLQSRGLIACQAPLSMGFSRQEYWSGLLCPSPEDLSDLGIEPGSPASRADSLPSEPPGDVCCKPGTGHTRFALEGCAGCTRRQSVLFAPQLENQWV